MDGMSDDVVALKDEPELRALFDSIDIDHSGAISMDEYFLWTLDVATKHGCGLEAIFRRYDTSGEGVLDVSEFSNAVEDMGFDTGFAFDLFMSLDDDGSGAVSCQELIAALTKRSGNVSTDVKKFVTTLAFADATTWDRGAGGPGGVSRKVDPRHDPRSPTPPTPQGGRAASLESVQARMRSVSWRLDATSAEGLRDQVHSMLLSLQLRDQDLFTLLSGGDTVRLTENRWTSEFKLRLGYVGDEQMLRNVFREHDVDSSGVMSLGEIQAWLTMRELRSTKAGDVYLLHSVPASVATLETLEWTADALRTSIQAMLKRHKLAPLDLLRAYDKSQDGAFSLKEFLVMLKNLVRPSSDSEVDLWYSTARPLIVDVFKQVAGRDQSCDVVELMRWLRVGWTEATADVDVVAEADFDAGFSESDFEGGASASDAQPSELGTRPRSRSPPRETVSANALAAAAKATKAAMTTAVFTPGSGMFAAPYSAAAPEAVPHDQPADASQSDAPPPPDSGEAADVSADAAEPAAAAPDSSSELVAVVRPPPARRMLKRMTTEATLDDVAKLSAISPAVETPAEAKAETRADGDAAGDGAGGSDPSPARPLPPRPRMLKRMSTEATMDDYAKLATAVPADTIAEGDEHEEEDKEENREDEDEEEEDDEEEEAKSTAKDDVPLLPELERSSIALEREEAARRAAQVAGAARNASLAALEAEATAAAANAAAQAARARATALGVPRVSSTAESHSAHEQPAATEKPAASRATASPASSALPPTSHMPQPRGLGTSETLLAGSALSFLNAPGMSDEQPAGLFSLYNGATHDPPTWSTKLDSSALPATAELPSPSPPLRVRLSSSPYRKPAPRSPYALPSIAPSAAPPSQAAQRPASSPIRRGRIPKSPNLATAYPYSMLYPAPSPAAARAGRSRPSSSTRPPAAGLITGGMTRSKSAATTPVMQRPASRGGGTARSAASNTSLDRHQLIRRSVEGLCDAIHGHAERLSAQFSRLGSSSPPGHTRPELTGGRGSATFAPAAAASASFTVSSSDAGSTADSERMSEAAEQLASGLRANSARVGDLFRRWDNTVPPRKGDVSRNEFHQGLHALGYAVGRGVIDALYDSWAAREPENLLTLSTLLRRLGASDYKANRPLRKESGMLSKSASLWDTY